MNGAVEPRDLVERYEASLAERDRVDRGAHYTPERLARALVRLALREFHAAHGRLPMLVGDPSCGAGSILLALVEGLVELGLEPDDALGRIRAMEVDPDAAAVATEALARWSRTQGGHGIPVPIEIGDALSGSARWASVELIVGNPPFASPLSGPVAYNRGAGSPYVDLAARHLAQAVQSAAPGAVACMLQPQSFLGSRDAEPIRNQIAQRCDLVALWASDEMFFANATVEVCAPVLRKFDSRANSERSAEVRVVWRDVEVAQAPMPDAGSWSPLLAAALGAPPEHRQPGRPARPLQRSVAFGSLAECTAGFRDEFYALGQCAVEASDVSAGDDRGERPERQESHQGGTPRVLKLFTSGLIDPGIDRWGERTCRIAGQSFREPVVDEVRLEALSPRVARWCSRRAVPKLLVASQTRVLEVCVDGRGDAVPVTPVVSVEPVEESELASLAALLSAPSSALRIARSAAGTGLSSGAVRVSAAALRELPMPADEGVRRRAGELWSELTALARDAATTSDWLALGVALDALLGVESPEAAHWWVDRLPKSVLAGVEQRT